jgi:hypothetical protein
LNSTTVRIRVRDQFAVGPKALTFVISIAQEDSVWPAVDFGRTARRKARSVVNGKIWRQRVTIEETRRALDAVSVARRGSSFSSAPSFSASFVTAARIAPRTVRRRLCVDGLCTLFSQRSMLVGIYAFVLRILI